MHTSSRDTNQLHHDLRNGPYHVFGEHSKCNTAFCKIRGEAEAGVDDANKDMSSDTETEPVEIPASLQQEEKQENDLSSYTLLILFFFCQTL